MLIPRSHRGLDFKVAAKPTARKRVSGFHRPLLRRRRGQNERPGQANPETEEEGEELDIAAGKGQVPSTSSSSPASEMSLLQELNSVPGSASSATATMLGTMEQDWALDSLDGFARMRMEQQDARRASHYAASTSAPTTSKGHSSSISGGKGFATGHPRTVYPSAMPVGVHAGAESGSHSGRRRPVVELDPLYARRNPHVLEALRLMKRVVHIRGDGSGTLDEVEESWSGADDSDEDANQQQGEDGAGSDMDWEEEEEELRGMPEEALEHEQAGPAAPSPSSSWAQSIEAAGFVLRQPTAQDGTTYLERVPAGSPSSTGPAAQPSNKLTPTPAARQPQKRSPTAAPVASVSPPPAVLAAAAASLVPRKDTRPKLKQALRKMDTPEQVLDLAAALYPTWASCGCRLAAPELLMAMMHTYKRASQEAAAEEAAHKAKGNQKSVTRGSSADIGSGKAAALVPTPAEAAQVLQGVAVAMRRAGWSRARCLQLCSDSRLVGLVEALRVVPPRLAAEQQQQEQLSRAFFRSARTYWLDHGGGGAGESGARQADLDGGAAVSASRDSRGTASGSSRDGKGGSDDVYRQTLAKFLNQQQQQPELDTGRAVSSHANEVEALIKEKRLSVTHKAFVSAVWALAVIGGPTLYSTEVEALLQIAKAGGGSWRFYEGEGANLAWALAASRHWSSRLADLEHGLVQSGGIPSLVPSDAVRVLWAFATLGGPPPQKLLSSIHPGWQWHVPQRNASSASPGAAIAGGSARAGRGSKSSSPCTSIGSGEGDLVGWDPMRDHPVPKQSLLAGVLEGGTHQQSGSAFQNATVENDASAHSSNSTSVGGHYTNSSGAAHSPPSSSKGIYDSRASLQGAVLCVPKGGKVAAAAGPPAPGGLSSFTTSQLAGCCWALAVMPGGVDSHAFQTAWAHLLQRLAGVDAGPQQGQAFQQQRRMPVISSDAAAHVVAGCSDAVLSQIWQAAMAVRLDSKWGPAAQQQQHQHQPQAGLPSTAATITAAASILTSRPPTNNLLSLREGHASSSSSFPSSKPPQDPIAEQVPGSPDTELLLSGAEHALLCAHEAFLRCSRALRGAAGHSSYQRAMANCLTSMRMMHVLEDSSSGYSVDISLPHLKLAIEADGPSHFSRTPGPPKPAAASSPSSPPSSAGPPVVSGPTAMKRRHLRALGWAVVSIPFMVWDRLGSDTARQQYMQQHITQAVADRVPIVHAPQ